MECGRKGGRDLKVWASQAVKAELQRQWSVGGADVEGEEEEREFMFRGVDPHGWLLFLKVHFSAWLGPVLASK